tara:strand:+ start:34 stop:471 length:438 start_codon:yes stop_codon:yes gene_type:complete
MSWKDIIKSRFEHDDKGLYGPSYLEESNAWEDMENPKEMKDFMTKDQMGSGVHMDLKDKTYLGVDKFITAFKKVSGKTKFNRGRYGVSNTMGGVLMDIMTQEGNLPQRQELWKLIQEQFSNPKSLERTGGEGWTTDEKNIPSWKR